jgi:hypothetical protein
MNVCLVRVHAASYNANRIGGVMVRVLVSIAVDRGFEPRSGHTKDCRSVIVLFLLAIVLPALALGDLKTLLALFLKQKRVRTFTWLEK